MLKGRLGLDAARVRYADRFGLVYLERGALSVEDGCLRFIAAEGGSLAAGDYQLPHQSVAFVLLGPGSTVSHDALRLLAAHGTGLAAVGADGVRCYTAPPLLPDMSDLARAQARVWSDAEGARLDIARRMYAWRLGEVLPHRDIAVLRGIEGARMKETYRLLAQQWGITWRGRRYDRACNSKSGRFLPRHAAALCRRYMAYFSTAAYTGRWASELPRASPPPSWRWQPSAAARLEASPGHIVSAASRHGG